MKERSRLENGTGKVPYGLIAAVTGLISIDRNDILDPWDRIPKVFGGVV